MTIDLQRYRSIFPPITTADDAGFREFINDFSAEFESNEREAAAELRKEGKKADWTMTALVALARTVQAFTWSARRTSRHIGEHLFTVEDRLAALERAAGITPPKPKLAWDSTAKQWRKAA